MSDTATISPTLKIPLQFSQVEKGIYRSAFITSRNYEYITSLNLKSMICLSPSDLKEDLKRFCLSRSLTIYEEDVGTNVEPFISMDHGKVKKVISTVTNPINQPCLIFCTTGKVRTCCIVGCLRKIRQWSMASIIAEFEKFADQEGTLFDVQCIESFVED